MCGLHLLYRVELPVDSDLLKRCLEALALRFDDAAVKIDRTVFNPSRIVKLYGTLTQKGDQTRPPGRSEATPRYSGLPPAEIPRSQCAFGGRCSQKRTPPTERPCAPKK